MESQNLVQQAINLARAGRREDARKILLHIVEIDPNNLTAWIWLSDLVDDPQDRIIALENALTIKPDQTQVKLRLDQIRKQAADDAQDKVEKPSAIEFETQASPKSEESIHSTRMGKFEIEASQPTGLADRLVMDIFSPERQPTGKISQPEPSSEIISESQILPQPSPTSQTVDSVQVPPFSLDTDPGLARLGVFSPHLSAEHLADEAKRVKLTLTDAKAALFEGKRKEAVDLLHQVIWIDPGCEEGWLLLSNATFDMEEKVECFEKALNINPENTEIKSQLEKFKPLLKNQLDLGHWYEENNDLERALRAYSRASIEARTYRSKSEADRAASVVKKRMQEPGGKIVSPTQSILRFSIAPILIYFFLVFIMGGENFLTMDPVLVFGILFVVPGAIFLAITITRPTHPAWVPLFRGLGEKNERLVHIIVGTISALLLLIPYGLLILNGIGMLEIFRLTHP